MIDSARLDAPPERLVRHVFWLYPIIAVVAIVVTAVLAVVVGSPNYPRDSIAFASKNDPGGAALAFTQELDGTSSSTANAEESGIGSPAQSFVLKPLRAAAPLLGDISVAGLTPLRVSDLRQAIEKYDSASAEQRMQWAISYHKALSTITPMSSSAMAMATPEYIKIGALRGDFGPVPALVEADIFLAQTGYLEQYLQSVDPGHSFHLTNVWLYDHPSLLNSAVDQGLTDDQWGMIKERGFAVGPWYLIVPAIFHVYFPGGASGRGFLLWNLAFAVLLMLVVPLLPGVRSLPRYLKFYRFIYRYPKPGELDSPRLRERHGPVHGQGGRE